MLGNFNGTERLDGFNVVIMDDLRNLYPDKFNESGGMDYKWFESEIRPYKHIYIRKDVNSISFTLQRGSSEDVGVNGCSILSMLEAIKQIAIYEGLEDDFESAIDKINN